MKDLEIMLNAVRDEALKVGLRMNMKKGKTEHIRFNLPASQLICSVPVQECISYRYLGCLTQHTSACSVYPVGVSPL